MNPPWFETDLSSWVMPQARSPGVRLDLMYSGDVPSRHFRFRGTATHDRILTRRVAVICDVLHNSLLRNNV